MRSLALILIAGTLSLSLQPAMAETSQQEKMQTCNANAEKKLLRGEARKLYMKGCLGGKKEVSAQQEKMKQCNVDASTQQLKGEVRRTFMKQCLSSSEHGAAAIAH